MAPKPGLYIIEATGDLKGPIGRFQIEDLSLMPKQTFLLQRDTGFRPAIWKLVPKGDNFTLSLDGAKCGVYNGKVYAFLLDDDRIAEWTFTEKALPVHKAAFKFHRKTVPVAM
ncbi:hypothetical protein ABW20_dc0106005 [Dactylellina cionopaga]|nr:hypothetical protein ABW20_dc0106005 [Dactylellina cionopaga]